MDKKINIKFNILISILLLLLSVYLLVHLEYKIIVIIVSLIMFVFYTFFYDLLYKLDEFSKRKQSFVFLILFVSFNLIQIVAFDFLNVTVILNILFNDFIFILSFALIYRRISFRDSIYTSAVAICLIPLVFNNLKVSTIGFLYLINAYAMISVEYYDSLSKKHILKYIIIGITTSVLFFCNPFYLTIFLFFIFMLRQNIQRKYFVLIIIIIAICGLLAAGCLFLFDTFNLLNTNVLEMKNLYFKIYINSLFFMMLISNCLCSIFVNKSGKYDFETLRVNNYYLLGIFMILVIGLFTKTFEDALVLLISSYAISNNQFKFIPKINYLKRYFRIGRVKKVSVVIPNYNYGKYICDRIDSILAQTYPIFELIILDDCSTDESVMIIEEKIKSLTNRNVKIKFIPNEENSGNVFKQWQKAFEYSTGDFLWIAEADDLCDKYFLNVVMKGFQSKNVVLSYTESKAIDENAVCFMNDFREWVDQNHTNHYLKSYINDGKAEIEQVLCTNNTIPNASGVVFKKDKNLEIHRFLKDAQAYKLAGDWFFYAKYLMNGSICYSSDSLNYHRIHKNSVTTSTDNYLRFCEIRKIQDMICENVRLSDDAKQRIFLTRLRLQNDYYISSDELKYENIMLSKLVETNNVQDGILLSIIIPVFNTEKYLKKCLNSFINDLPDKTEVLIINDGSPDNSESIIKEYSKKYNSIRYIKKKNGGLSSVKNVGLKEAKGRYIIFLDSDDYVSSDMYNTMLKKAIDEDADIVCCDVLEVYEDNKFEYVSSKNPSQKGLLEYIDNPLMAASWSKMVKKDLYVDLFFPDGLNNEDVAVTPLLFIRSKRTVHIPSPFYKYVQRSGSIQNSGFSEKRFVIFETSKICLDLIEKYGCTIYELVQYSLIAHQLLTLLISFISKVSDYSERLKFIKIFCQKFNEMDFKIDPRKNVLLRDYTVAVGKSMLVENVVENNYEKIDEIITNVSEFKQ